ncbi:acyl-CoA dehydrogenase [Ramlibacter henchirensis]|uniref:Acyl-CoA dehydrogenase n=1 Tax=Ramlibacter henchirensis TaxID=204072 RepID=A0A4Z0BWI1_9BURK|nr:acyl-CoA dehydrogenase family protein [Ramlibacter henchirensis]TFZ02710.1 acyl-CoA dehydrogenase [Ramlibacter henchirensis]
MRFEPDTDQEQLQGSLRRLLQSEASFERRRRTAAGETGWDSALWRSLSELGVTALTLTEDHGGFGQRPVAWLPALQELGYALALQPFIPSAVLAATAISRAGTPAQQQRLLPGVAQASRVLAFAHDEAAARHAALWVEATARQEGGQWRIDGVKQGVLFGAAADLLVVTARTGGSPGDPAGLALFIVDPAQEGVRRTPLRLIDDTPAADIALHAARAEPLGEIDGPGPWRAVQAAQEAGLAAACAEGLGVAERAYALTVEYVQTRQQFGRPIGANQVVRHRVAEMRVALEMLRSAALAGLLALEEEDAQARSRELSRAKLLLSRHGSFVTGQAIQLHGGIGMTAEYAAGHCLRRFTVLDQLFGDGPTHAARLGASLAAAAH